MLLRMDLCKLFKGAKTMIFPDLNIGYVFGYKSMITKEGILITFIGGIVKILFKYINIEQINRKVYSGERISWDVIRWGKCPPGKEALKIVLKQGAFRNHFIIFDDLEKTICDLKSLDIDIK